MPRNHGKTARLEAVNSGLATADKIDAELNLQFIMLAAPTTPRFDYMFPALQDDSEALLPVTGQTVVDLKRLGRAMGEAGATTQLDSATPAAYTYFGQLLDHEITLTREMTPGGLMALNDPTLAPIPIDTVQRKIVNGRSPRLDLDCVYGLLPHGIPEFRDGDRMRLGKVSVAGNRPPGKDDFNDLNRKPPSTDQNIDREAIIGDERNDENLIIAQLHVAFLRAHNALVDRGLSFAQASLLMRQHFQWLVIHDFLKRIADPEIVNEILERGQNRFYRPPAGKVFMPLEFSVAAYRFGHSMVRDVYRYNLNFPKATLSQLFALTAFNGNINPAPGNGFATLPENWIIEWEDFLDGGLNSARRIDPQLAEPLFALRDITGARLPDEAMLPVRNLLRGYMLRIPTGQAVAKEMGLPVMADKDIKKAVGKAQAKVLRETGLLTRTPLWYYILAESADHLPDHLGPVGSTIVAEVLIELARRSEDSILASPGWKPTLGPNPGRFTLRDLLRLAGALQPRVLQQGSGAGAASIHAQETISISSKGGQDMSIIENVRTKKAEYLANAEKARKNRDKAVAAIKAGIRSKAWKNYMEQFADTPDQLMRLMGTDGTLGDKDLDIKRAYLVANAVCGAGSTDEFDMGVDTIDH